MPTVNHAVIPSEIKHWSWGAFFWTWLWAVANDTYIGLLALIPGLNLFMAIVLGIKGNAWAWENGQWQSLQDFKRVQRKWAVSGWVIFILGFFVFFSGFIMFSQTAVTNPTY